MGMGLTLSCPKCDYKVDLTLGIGMLFFPEAFEVFDRKDENNMWVSVIESKPILDDIEVIINQKDGRINEENYGYEIYYSKTCKTLCSRFYFELLYVEDGQQKVYTPKYFDKHNKRLVKVNVEDILALDLVCPKCKSRITGDPGTVVYPGVLTELMCWD